MSNNFSKDLDPNRQNEAEKYENPIPSREYIMQFLEHRGQTARRAEIIEAFDLVTEEEQEALRRRLRAMERDGQLVFTRRGGYGLVGKMNLIPGRVIGHKDGYGFIVPDDNSGDLYLNAYQMRSVFDGDKVLVRVSHIDRKGRREAEIVDILERHHEQVVGRYYFEKGVGIVTPENQKISQDILIPLGQENGAKEGQYVVVEIIAHPTLRTQAMGKVTEVIGEHMAPGMEIDVAIRSYNLPYLWPDVVKEQAATISEQVEEADKVGRVDLRNKSFITIDGEDAKDFDDAVYCEKLPKGGYRLYVAIADVSHYVQPGSPLDLEAEKRGNSVYFPGRVIPMLPEVLSNGLCSLRSHQDRLALVCEIALDKDVTLKRFRFYEAVIHSQARMTYTNVAKILVDKNKVLTRQYERVLPNLQYLYELYQKLAVKRKSRGALEFETTETRVVFGANRKIEAIIPYERNDAHKLIEECMLLANVCAARYLLKDKVPALYRVHQGPSTAKLEDLRKFLAELGLAFKGSKQPKPKDYAILLASLKDRADKHLIETVMLRSLSQAVYSPENIGHFGLAYDAYTHFTSPIRRYPDLLVHRQIKSLLKKQQGEKVNWQYTEESLQKLGDHCSYTERRADEATRDVLLWLKCEYMQDKVGEEYDGVITGVTGFGVFVELQKIYVEGLVHVTALENDYFQFDPVKHRLVGERTRTIHRLADKIKVRVVRVDLDARKIDFELAQNYSAAGKNKKAKATASDPKNVTKTTTKSKAPKRITKPKANPLTKAQPVSKKVAKSTKKSKSPKRKNKVKL